MPKISVVMACFNAELTVGRAIDSIINQSFGDFEFIIVDDGSIDDTYSILMDYKERDARIIIFRNDKNMGLAYSLNKGINSSRGEYIARMDADDISLPQRFHSQINFMNQNSEIDVLGSNVINCYSNGFTDESRVDLYHRDIYANRYKKTPVFHPTVMIRRRCFEHSSYNPNLKWAEDRDLWLRWMDVFTFANLEEALLLYTVKEKITATIFIQNHIVLFRHLPWSGAGVIYLKDILRSIVSQLIKIIRQ